MVAAPTKQGRSVVFNVEDSALPGEIKALLSDYRRMVNQAIRAGLTGGVTALASLKRLAYRPLAAQYKGLSVYVSQAIYDAVGLLRAYRRRQRRVGIAKPPFVSKLHLRALPSLFHFDLVAGKIRLSVGNGKWVMFSIPTSAWHRAQLLGDGVKVAYLLMKPGRVVLVFSSEPPIAYEPQAILALDTNEVTLDGVLVERERSRMVRVPLAEVRLVQARHFARRRKLAAKKAHDRRIRRRLLSREGKRESDRVRNRLNVISKGVVAAAKKRRAAVVLEDLTGIRRFFSPSMNRRLSSWPHRELHRQVAYKAQAAGVPVIFVDPYLTSQKCAMCGWTPKRSNARKSARQRSGMYVCGNPDCRWTINRQFNAGINILRTALTERPGLGGVRFHLDALTRDVMNPLCEPSNGAARGERMERESNTTSRDGRPPSTASVVGRQERWAESLVVNLAIGSLARLPV